MRIAALIVLSLSLSGCIMPAKPAKTVVTPGESSFKSNTTVQLPKTETWSLKTKTAAPVTPSKVIIRTPKADCPPSGSR